MTLGYLIFALAPSASAQAPEVPTTTVEPDDKKGRQRETIEALREGKGTGGYGGPEFGFGLLGGRAASRVGSRAGWVATRNLIVGGFAEGINSDTEANEPVRIVDAGAFLETQIAPYQTIHASIEGGVGVGSVAWGANRAAGFLPYAAVRLEVNVVEWFRLSVGPNLRGIVSNAVPVDKSRVSGGLDVALKFGAF
ncbi:MAG: hypothetical protein AAGA48_25500 [Myxococcota bacterium]